jgi:glucose/mannose-6-phosphate isomerase
MAMVRQVIICGMGGSALPGYALDSWTLVTGLPLRVTIWNCYGLPPLEDKSVPIFCVSYSGNTEETLSSFEMAQKRGYKVFAITSGGKLAALARARHLPLRLVVSGIPPRIALAPMTAAILEVLESLKICKIQKKSKLAFQDFNPLQFKKAGMLERKLAKSIPLIYTPREWYAVGHIWKIAFNETAKIPAFSYTLPEANHNEMEGFAELPSEVNRNFYALFLDFKNSHPRIRKRIKLSQKVWKDAGISTKHFVIPNDEFWKTFFSLVKKGYVISNAIAALRKIDPNVTAKIEEFKKWMAK